MSIPTYDFVIVGGGTSGLMIANRLTENPDITVLVMEAGDSHLTDPRVTVPALCLSLQGTEADWNFTTTSQVIDQQLAQIASLAFTDSSLTAWPERSRNQSATRPTARWLKRHQSPSADSSIEYGYRCLGKDG